MWRSHVAHALACSGELQFAVRASEARLRTLADKNL
jgi:hypothetical protein